MEVDARCLVTLYHCVIFIHARTHHLKPRAAVCKPHPQVLTEQMALHADLPSDVRGLETFTNRPSNPNWAVSDGKLVWQHGRVVMNFGKHRGRSLQEMRESDMVRGEAGVSQSRAAVAAARFTAGRMTPHALAASCASPHRPPSRC